MNKIGVMLSCGPETDFRAKFREAKEMGIESCQISLWNPALHTEEYADRILSAMREENFTISSFWAGWTGPCEWNFTAGPDTLGIVPPAYRAMRLEQLKAGARFAARLGIQNVITHAGFLPENAGDPNYPGVVAALRHLCRDLATRGQNFLFETGQETPVTLLRCIEDIGTGNVFINLDTANLILYGKANTADAVRVFGKYVRDTHIKDGFYPTDGRNLGREVKVGDGLANIPLVYKLLRECGYEGPLTIEREISGDEQRRDIAATAEYLRAVMSNA